MGLGTDRGESHQTLAVALGLKTTSSHHSVRLTYCVLEDTLLEMIRTFKDRRTEQLFEGGRVRQFEGFSRQAERRLRLLDAADTLEALRHLPSNRLEALRGDRQGQYSIRINQQWRVCFEWYADGPHNVEIVDYHA